MSMQMCHSMICEVGMMEYELVTLTLTLPQLKL